MKLTVRASNKFCCAAVLCFLLGASGNVLAVESSSTWPPIPFAASSTTLARQERAYNGNEFDYGSNSNDDGDYFSDSSTNEYYRAVTAPAYDDVLAEIGILRNNSRVQQLLQSSNYRVRCSCPQVTCNCGTATALQQAGANETARCVCDCATAATTHAVVAALSRRQAFACPAGTFSDLSSFAPSKCYFLSSAVSSPTASLSDAVMQCQQMNTGPSSAGVENVKKSKSKLAEPMTDAEARTLLDIIAKEGGETNSTNSVNAAAFWTGIIELVAPTTNQLLYVSTAQPLQRSLEQSIRGTQKLGDTAQDCYAIVRDGKGGAQWSNRDCSELLRYVCEMEPSLV